MRVRLCRARRLFVPRCPGPQPRKLPERFRAGDGDGVAERRSGDANRYRQRAAARLAQRTPCRRERLPDAAGKLTLRPYFSPPFGKIAELCRRRHSPGDMPTLLRKISHRCAWLAMPVRSDENKFELKSIMRNH